MKKKLSPVLMNPRKTFDWRLGDTRTRAFVGEVDGRMVVVFVAKDGPCKGKVISGWVVTPDNKKKWGL